jgi:hypothetical protein
MVGPWCDAIMGCLECRKRQLCVADEAYFGTVLSFKLGGHMEGHFTGDSAMAMLAPGQGVPVEDVDVEMLVQARGATTNTSRLPLYMGPRQPCHAKER